MVESMVLLVRLADIRTVGDQLKANGISLLDVPSEERGDAKKTGKNL